MTERFNQTLTKVLIKMTQKNEGEGVKQLPTVLLGCRATIQAYNSWKPYHLLHGREITLAMPDMARLPAPAVGYEDATTQAMMDNL